jgi:hypothetical protein
MALYLRVYVPTTPVFTTPEVIRLTLISLLSDTVASGSVKADLTSKVIVESPFNLITGLTLSTFEGLTVTVLVFSTARLPALSIALYLIV